MCPSCEANPINKAHGVCTSCAEMYAEVDPNWKQSEWGRFLVGSNLETMRMAERIAHEPTGFDIETVAEDAKETSVHIPKDVDLNELVEAMVNVHGWGARRIHSFLVKAGYNPPHWQTLHRRVLAIRKKAAA
jgi:hypothetical protein